MQRHHLLLYLAAVDDPSSDAGVDSQINFQSYAGFNMAGDAGYEDWGLTNVRTHLAVCRTDKFAGSVYVVITLYFSFLQVHHFKLKTDETHNVCISLFWLQLVLF